MAPVTDPREPGPAPETDPVLVRREQIRRIASAGQRLGFLIYAIDAVLFFVALVVGFEGILAQLVTIGLIAGSVVLAPSIILAYTVRAADRDDRERGL
jgi:hypothetical protein